MAIGYLPSASVTYTDQATLVQKFDGRINDGENYPDVSIKALGWLTCPVSASEEDAELPAISVFSDPEATEELELVVHSNGEGQAQVTGQRFVSLKSQGSDKPSVASFTDIRIKRAGMYVFEVRAVRNTEISLVADHATTIEPVISTHSNTTDVTLPEELGLGKIQTWGV